MDGMDAKLMLGILEKVLSESMLESEGSEQDESQKLAVNIYNEIRHFINNDLVKVIEHIGYEKKYDVVHQANALAESIGLYLNYPDIINHYVVGFYDPTPAVMKILCKKYLPYLQPGNSLLDKLQQWIFPQEGFSDTIPTIITYGTQPSYVQALNLAEKSISLTTQEYWELEAGTKQIELSAVLYSYHFKSHSIPSNQAIILLPPGADKAQDYYSVLFRAFDTLVLQAGSLDQTAKDLICRSNIKEVLMIGECNLEQTKWIDQMAEALGIRVQKVNSASDLNKLLLEPCRNYNTNNFCNQLLMKHCLSGVLWYLAERKIELYTLFRKINPGLLSSDQTTVELAKKMQSEAQTSMKTLNQCSESYYNVMRNILAAIVKLEAQYHIDEKESPINLHVDMRECLLEMLVADSAFYQAYRKPTADFIRRLGELYARVSGRQAEGQVLIHDCFSEPQDPNELAAFAHYKTANALILKKKISMYQELKLSAETCANMIQRIERKRSPLEHRLLGIAYLAQDKLDQASVELKRALQGGDMEAGNLLYNIFASEVPVAYLAEWGVAQAACQNGKQMYEKYRKNPNQTNWNHMLRNFHISAAQNHVPSFRLLGEIWFERAMSRPNGKEYKELLQRSLQYYKVVLDKGGSGKKLYERIGSLNYLLENYRDARTFLEKANTSHSCFLLGQIFENANGVAQNEAKALEYYQQASNRGHAQAQIEYNRLFAKIEAKKEKKEFSEDEDYKESTSTSSSYSNGGVW